MCVHVVARRDGATHACVLWANKLLWCFRESLTAFLLLPAAPRRHSLLLGAPSRCCRCFGGVRSTPSSAHARAGLSLVSGSSIPPLLASHWSAAALTHPSGLSLVIGISIPPLLASHWSTAFLARPWPLIGERQCCQLQSAEGQSAPLATGSESPSCPLRRQPVAVPFAVGCGDLGRLKESGPPPL